VKTEYRAAWDGFSGVAGPAKSHGGQSTATYIIGIVVSKEDCREVAQTRDTTVQSRKHPLQPRQTIAFSSNHQTGNVLVLAAPTCIAWAQLVMFTAGFFVEVCNVLVQLVKVFALGLDLFPESPEPMNETC